MYNTAYRNSCRVNVHVHLPIVLDSHDVTIFMWATLVTGATLHKVLNMFSSDLQIQASQAN